MRAKWVWSLFLMLTAAPIASAQSVDPLAPFQATAFGTARADFSLQTASGTVSDTGDHRHLIGVQVFAFRTTGGAVGGWFLLVDFTRGTVLSQRTISDAGLFIDDNGHLFLVLNGAARVHDPQVNDNLPGYSLVLHQTSSNNFEIQVSDVDYLLFYENVSLGFVQITPH